MTDHFINLNCTGCGGKLDVYDDLDRFVCGYCGSAMIVQRRGGTVALKAVTEAIKQVQIGTDKTASELAIVRFEKELTELRGKLAAAGDSTHSGKVTMACGGLVLLFALILVPGSALAGVIALVIGAAVIFFGYHAFKNKKGEPILARIRLVKEQMAEKKRLVES